MLTLFVDETPEKSCERLVSHLVQRWKDGAARKLGGATGRTFLKVYPRLLDHPEAREWIPEMKIWFLDEYFGQGLYHAYAHHHLGVSRPEGFRAENVHVPRGIFFDENDQKIGSSRLEDILESTTDQWTARAEPGEDGFAPEIAISKKATHPVLCAIRDANARYDAMTRKEGGDRIQLLGLGVAGHIGFNEQGCSVDAGVSLVKLASSTCRENAPDFELTDGNGAKVHLESESYAITQGIGTILHARELALAAHGKGKAKATRRMLLDEPSPQCPAAFVQVHHRAAVFLDRASFADLDAGALRKKGFQVELS